VCVAAIGDGGMSSRCCWWTCGVALVGLWDSGHRSMRNKRKKEHTRHYCVKGADYGCGGGLKVGHSIKDVPTLFINNKKFFPTCIVSYKSAL
jgi:hypothetical protein